MAAVTRPPFSAKNLSRKLVVRNACSELAFRFGAFAAILPLLGLLCVSQSVALASPASVTADRIVIEKSARTMKLMHGNDVIKTYKVALGAQPTGAKDRQGDHKTPEGIYTVDAKKPHSLYHMALHISYPSAADRERAKQLGVSPGGDVEIHGLPDAYARLGAAHRREDWTDGCIALTDQEIEEIWPRVAVGTVVEIRP
jgi:murein L,D-transpeptidase YafK